VLCCSQGGFLLKAGCTSKACCCYRSTTGCYVPHSPRKLTCGAGLVYPRGAVNPVNPEQLWQLVGPNVQKSKSQKAKENLSTYPCALVAHPTLSVLLLRNRNNPAQASAQYLPTTAAAAAAAPSRAEGPCPRAPWQQKLRMTWQQHPVIALVCSLLFLMVVGLLLGVAIGVSARNQGSFPWWAKGTLHSQSSP